MEEKQIVVDTRLRDFVCLTSVRLLNYQSNRKTSGLVNSVII